MVHSAGNGYYLLCAELVYESRMRCKDGSPQSQGAKVPFSERIQRSLLSKHDVMLLSAFDFADFVAFQGQNNLVDG
jgi:hypothetical protein